MKGELMLDRVEVCPDCDGRGCWDNGFELLPCDLCAGRGDVWPEQVRDYEGGYCEERQ